MRSDSSKVVAALSLLAGSAVLIVATFIVGNRLSKPQPVTPQSAEAYSTANCATGIVLDVPVGCSPGQANVYGDVWWTNDNIENTEIQRKTISLTNPGSQPLSVNFYWGWSGGTLPADQQPNEEHDVYLIPNGDTSKRMGPYHCTDFGDYPTYNNPVTAGGQWVKCGQTLSVPWNSSWTKLDVEIKWNSTNKTTPGSHLGSVVAGWCGTTPVVPTPGTVVPTQRPEPTASLPGVNLLKNPGFESGVGNWNMASPTVNGAKTALFTTVTSIKSEGTRSARIEFTSAHPRNSAQFYQHSFTLLANTTYEVSFDAYSTTGHDFKLGVIEQDQDYTNYSLTTSGSTFQPIVDLGTSWGARKVYTFKTPADFDPTVSGNQTTVSDARLRFLFDNITNAAAPGDFYYVDNVKLVRK